MHAVTESFWLSRGARDAADEGGGNRVFETRVCFLVGSC